MTTHEAERAADDGLYAGTPMTEDVEERVPLGHLLFPVFREPPVIETKEDES